MHKQHFARRLTRGVDLSSTRQRALEALNRAGALAMAYAIKDGGRLSPLTRFLPPDVLLAGSRNTIVFERDPALKEQVHAGHHLPLGEREDDPRTDGAIK